MNRRNPASIIAVVTIAFGAWAQDQSSPAPASIVATAARGTSSHASFMKTPSWLSHLQLTVGETRMGQMGGSASSPTQRQAEMMQPAAPATLSSVMQQVLATYRSNSAQSAQLLKQTFPVTGEDLYRWNCQACHGADGKGAPPEINSLLGPVQGTSPALWKARMAARGIDADDDMAAQASDMAATSLRDRLRVGGKSMPAFEYLNTDEVEALLGYLEKLAEVPGSKRSGLVVQESAGRVGEHILRGTCHICHDGSGQVTAKGAIPPLASIPQQQSVTAVVHQVAHGSSIKIKMMGGPVMPAFPYFTNDEIAAAYLVLYSAAEQ